MIEPDYEYKGKCHIRFFNCDNMEFMTDVDKQYDLDIMELDKEYFDKGVLAFKQHVSQYSLFNN